MMNDVVISQVEWSVMEAQLRTIRTRVFIEEQNVPEELEWGDDDIDCIHLLANKNSEYIATARLLKTGQIGRMAVLNPYRRQGIGSKMLEKLISIAKDMDIKTVFLNAQTDAVGFYQRFGFQETGGIFDDAGIPHIRMNKII